MNGRTELRIHGVSGTTPEAVLGHPVIERVAGDDKAGFYRRAEPALRYSGDHEPDSVSDRQIEAYCWGNLTSGSAARAGWLMLLPFMLVNLAHWMSPASPADAGRGRVAAGRATAVLLRLFGLALTLTLVLTAVQVAMDLAGWQCAGIQRCGASSPLTTMLTDGWLSQPGRRVVVSALVPLAVVLGVAMLGRRPLRRPRRRMSPEPDAPSATGAEPLLFGPGFWRGDPDMPALRSAHVTAATALLSATVTWPATTLAATGTMRTIGFALCLASLGLLATAVILVAVEGVTGRAAHASALVVTARRLAVVLLTLGAVYSVWDHGAWDAAGRLPGLRSAVLLTFGVGLVLLALVAAAVAAQLPWTAGDGGFRAGMRGFGAPAMAASAFLIAGGFSAGLAYRVADHLGYPVLSQTSADAERAGLQRVIADESQPFATRADAWAADMPLVLPPSFAWAGAAATVIFAAVLVIAGVIAIGVSRRIGPLARRIAVEYNAQRQEDTADASTHGRSEPQHDPSDPDVRRVALVVALASLTDGAGRIIGRVVLVSSLALLASLGIYAGGADNWSMVEDPPLSTLTAFGTWLMGAFAVGLVGLVWSTARNPALRRTVGVLWDIGSFWPRAAHPLAPPSYGERAIPDLVARVEALAAAPSSRVVLSGHSQGSILAVATVMQLPADTARRVDMITHGSPLRRLYARHFPAHVNHGALRSVLDDLGGRWRNLYRHTDPVGSWIFVPDDGTDRPADSPEAAVDRRFLDPPTLKEPIAGHSEYWNDARYSAQLAAVSQD